MHAGYEQYIKNKVVTSSPLEQVALILDKASQHALTAHKASVDHKIEERFIATDKAIILLNGLLGSLEKNPKPEVKEFVLSMDAFYRQMIVLLMNVNVKQDSTLSLKISKSLQEMAQLWRQADQSGNTTTIQKKAIT